jgi:hypothetical protein
MAQAQRVDAEGDEQSGSSARPVKTFKQGGVEVGVSWTGLALSIKPNTSLLFTILDLPAQVLSKTGIANRPT